ncbi:MAG: plasmid pRiA4b ORF-3 family protein [Bacteroidales bacterium]|nr:plasmid pRiA4b ORF-3 family protein [Bacteroidales bacterium]
MYYYKFKVYYDEVDDFVRDVEILANDNFESFHHLLYECIGLKGNELACFSICDPKWNKQKEITLVDMSDDEAGESDGPEYNDEDSFSTKSNLPNFVMKDALLKDFITDPHQHIIYEYDFMEPKVFYIELQKVLKTDEDASKFPRCTFKSKEMPVVAKKPELTEDDEFDFEDEDIHDEFNDGYDEDDFSGLNELDQLV